jgi:DNA-directed DNA polymerase III PolC
MHVPLHVKSDFSAGYGTATIDELVRCAARHGCPAIALTDVENMYGQVHFHLAARALGLRAITGVELRQRHGPRFVGDKLGRLVLLARDRAGYESLCRIVTARRREPAQPSGASTDCLDTNPRGVFFLSDDVSVLDALLRAGVSEADVRFLLVRPGGAKAPSGVRAVADTDVVMAHPADRALHALRLAIKQRRTIETATESEPSERSFADAPGLRALFADAPDAVTESLRVAEACELHLGEGPLIVPSIERPSGHTADGILAAACRARLDDGRRARRWERAIYDIRLREELGVIQQLGLADYFLIVAEIADYVREHDIALVGRGSAVSSLVAHLLGVTAVDPIVHGLYFERFLHLGRRDPPDVDLDLPSDRRDEVIGWVFRRFGRDRVAMVSTHQRFQRRSAFREGLKAFGMRAVDVDRFCERLPTDGADAEAPLPLALLIDRYRTAVPLIERLIGTFQHLSVHPGGIVIATPRTDRHAPLERAPKGVVVTQYDAHALARLGMAKIDLLGNRALAAIQQTCRLAGIALPEIDADVATLEALREGHTIGSFQVETPTVRSTLRKLPLNGLEDLVAALAIVRPGPASGEAKAAYVRRARGQEPPDPPHPRLAPVVRQTHGLLLYEEQLMATIALMTGWPLHRADEMRAALVRAQGDGSQLAELGQSFTQAATTTGVSSPEALHVWRILERFASYSFSKAHAASYTRVAWQSTFLNIHRPVEFACAVLNHYGGHYPLRTVAAEFSRRGVEILAPHVNTSGPITEVQAGAVRLGLSAMKRLTMNTRRTLLAQRPFRDIDDLIGRVAPSLQELGALFLSGACDGLLPLSAENYPFAHQDLLERLRERPLTVALGAFTPREVRGRHQEIYRALFRIRNELIYLSMHPTAHPMSVLREEAARAECIQVAHLPERRGEVVRIAGVVAATRRLATHGGSMMQFVTLEDESGLVEVVLFSGTYAALRDPVTTPGPFLVTGRVEDDSGDVHLVASGMLPFHARAHAYQHLGMI